MVPTDRLAAIDYWSVALVYFVIALPCILWSHTNFYDAYDETNNHFPIILQFYRTWPHPDLRSYATAQTPLYHLMMAGFVGVIGPRLTILRLLNSLFGLACAMLILRFLRSRTSWDRALMFTLCIVVSPYFLGPAVRLSTDALALLLAIGALFLLLGSGAEFVASRAVKASAIEIIAVLVRQVYLWLGALQFIKTFTLTTASLRQRLLNGSLALLPLVALIPFVWLWKGLVNQSFQTSIRVPTNVNWDVPIYVASLLGALGSVFLPWQIALYRESDYRMKHLAALIAIGWLVLIAHPVKASGPAGGWLWRASEIIPPLFGSSLTFWLLVPLGLIYARLMASSFRKSGDTLAAVAPVLWAMSYMLTSKIFQKYYEPAILFFIALALSPVRIKIWKPWLLPAAFLSGYVVVDIVRFW